MCVAAAKQNEEALKYVDLEFRTDALLLATCYEENAGDPDSPQTYTYEENRTPSGDETTYITVYGKAPPGYLEAAWNIVRRSIEAALGEDMGWGELWRGDEKLGCLELSMAPDKKILYVVLFLQRQQRSRLGRCPLRGSVCRG